MVQEEKQHPTPGQRRQEEPAEVRSEQQRVEVTDVRSHRSTRTPEKLRRDWRGSGLPHNRVQGI